ncbi:hypothetical protein MPLDJ20_200045 [Mesorhizobium plurifarium]|uniref:Uncharacterized protein n=1 Tax=Mesorhizobium plurifarium TaxID=69974 RepID=A0A090F134_MESPL|nr:hypothetical protein MPLDJ20_200045 [Mesorhizobium plurifarium]
MCGNDGGQRSPLSVRFADTSPPLCGGEEKPIAEAAPFATLGSSPPPEAGERWLGEAETERGSALCD